MYFRISSASLHSSIFKPNHWDVKFVRNFKTSIPGVLMGEVLTTCAKTLTRILSPNITI